MSTPDFVWYTAYWWHCSVLCGFQFHRTCAGRLTVSQFTHDLVSRDTQRLDNLICLVSVEQRRVFGVCYKMEIRWCVLYDLEGQSRTMHCCAHSNPPPKWHVLCRLCRVRH